MNMEYLECVPVCLFIGTYISNDTLLFLVSVVGLKDTNSPNIEHKREISSNTKL